MINSTQPISPEIRNEIYPVGVLEVVNERLVRVASGVDYLETNPAVIAGWNEEVKKIQAEEAIANLTDITAGELIEKRHIGEVVITDSVVDDIREDIKAIYDKQAA